MGTSHNNQCLLRRLRRKQTASNSSWRRRKNPPRLTCPIVFPLPFSYPLSKIVLVMVTYIQHFSSLFYQRGALNACINTQCSQGRLFPRSCASSLISCSQCSVKTDLKHSFNTLAFLTSSSPARI